MVVVTDQPPLKQALQKPKASGHLVKWSVELSEFNIRYRPRVVIKAQALADFVAECIKSDKGISEDQLINEENSNRVLLIMVYESCGE